MLGICEKITGMRNMRGPGDVLGTPRGHPGDTWREIGLNKRHRHKQRVSDTGDN